MKWTTAIVLGAGLWLAGPAPAPHMPSEAEAAGSSREGRMTIREYKKWQDEIKRRTRQLKRTAERPVKWGDELRATRSNMLVLDPPLKKGSGPGTVHVEVFQRLIDDDGHSVASIHAKAFTVIEWFGELLEQEDLPVTLNDYTVGKGPGLSEEFEDARAMLQEMTEILSWRFPGAEDPETAALGRRLLRMGMKGQLRNVKRRVDMERLIRDAGIDEEKWEKAAKGIRDKWIPHIDRRWKDLAETALSQFPGVFDAIPDPIILIDGKCLITQNTMRRQGGMHAPQRVLRAANWVIRRQWERLPQYGFDAEEIKWGKEKRPKRGEIVELKDPFPQKDQITVEWAHTYITADGEAKAIEWFEDVRHGWNESLRNAGIDNVRTSRIPLVDEEGNARSHQMIHREATIAWGPDLPQRRNRIHFAMAGFLAKNPLGLGNHEEVGDLLDRVPHTNRQIYEAVRTSSKRIQMLEEAKAKGKAMTAALAGKRKIRDPIFLVNGKYVIATADVTKSYQILNWAIRKLQGHD